MPRYLNSSNFGSCAGDRIKNLRKRLAINQLKEDKLQLLKYDLTLAILEAFNKFHFDGLDCFLQDIHF
ncbi:hypothetical protein RIF29_11952 [Crotalaria pallida]|uniref:Uncharacterized protein n=1 Tax=Crotalaria pallida TaxID=3830 RepID=A0AAN9IMN6_CROPI